MRKEFHAEVYGHEQFAPDPDNPKQKAVRVKALVSSLEPAMGKPTRAIFVIEKADLAEFAMGQGLRITIQDSQQELSLGAPSKKGKKAAQLGIVPPEDKKRGSGHEETEH